MTTGKRHRNRRVRRQTKARWTRGVKAKPRHVSKGGRTGGVHTKKPKAKHNGGGRVVTAILKTKPQLWPEARR
jgi:hypothetical protein